MNWAKIGLFAGGALFGSAGIEILTSKDAKKLYTQCTAAVLRMKDQVMKTATSLQENCGDILADAKEINEQRNADDDAVIEDAADAKGRVSYDDSAASRLQPLHLGFDLPVTAKAFPTRGEAVFIVGSIIIMKWNILHESRGRIRLHLNKPRLSMAEADQLQAYLADLPGVRVAVVYKRTCDAVITYTGARTDVLRGAAAFRFDVQGPDRGIRQQPARRKP